MLIQTAIENKKKTEKSNKKRLREQILGLEMETENERDMHKKRNCKKD